jgi:hypothetical protein
VKTDGRGKYFLKNVKWRSASFQMEEITKTKAIKCSAA